MNNHSRKVITGNLAQLKLFEETLKTSIEGLEFIVNDFELEEEGIIYKRLVVMKDLLCYIQQDIEDVEEYEKQLEAYYRQLEKEEDL